MSGDLDELKTPFNVPDGRVTHEEDQQAVDLAQASIDGYHTSDWSQAGSHGVVDQAEFEKLSAVLELMGSLDADSSARNRLGSDEPLRIGRYEVIGERGRGGFGIVLKAIDSLLQREVALKIPRPERLLAGQTLDELVREARMVAKLSHPGIVRVYEVRRWGPVWYIASDYCAGPTLAEWLAARRGPVSLRTIAEIMTAATDAVQYAHSRGVLHLDLKPENILLEPSPGKDTLRPMVTDFGLSHDDAEISDRGRIGGTLNYMAPEQKARDAERIGVATDVYALGVILAELIHATRVPAGEALPVDEKALSSSSSPDLAAVCRRCLATDPADRYPSAQGLADDLRRFLVRKPVTARPLNWPLVAAYYCRRKPFASTMIVSLLTTLVVSGVLVVAAWRESERHLKSLTVAEQRQREAVSRMEKSLLRFASFAQEANLRMVYTNDETSVVTPDRGEFLLEAQRWAEAGPDAPRLSGGVEAAVKSMFVAGETKGAGDEAVTDQFHVGMALWLEMIRQEPRETRWHQALAVHLLAEKLREADEQWFSWRSARWIPDRTVLQSVETRYALLLIDYVKMRFLHPNPRASYGMLADALKVLNDDRVDSSLDDQQRLYWRIMANQLAATAATEYSWPEEAAVHLAEATRLIDSSPAPGDCDARLAALIATTLVNQGKRWSKSDDAAALPAFERASVYAARAVEAAPENWLYLLAFVDQQRRLASLHRRHGRVEAGQESLRQALHALDHGVARCGKIRQLLRERATLSADLAEDCLLRNDRTAACQLLEKATKDFASLELTSRDPKPLWLNYGRTLLTLTNVYAETEMELECRETHKRLTCLMNQMTQKFADHRMQRFVRQVQQAASTLPFDLAESAVPL